MKKIYFFFLIISIFISYSQWQPDVRLTNDTSSSSTSNSYCIVANDNIIHIVWCDLRDGNPEIYYKRSSDGGISWSADIRLTNNIFYSYSPSIALSGSYLHVVWYDYRDGFPINTEIYYKRSTDGGFSWQADQRLTSNTAYSLDPALTVIGQFVHVVWYDYRDGSYPNNAEIYYKSSTNGGLNWESDTRLTYNHSASTYPSISGENFIVHVLWEDNRDQNVEIYYKRSSDNGINWVGDIRLTNDPNNSRSSSISISGLVVHASWVDDRNGNDEIYYKRSIDGGINWAQDTKLTNNYYLSWGPSVSTTGFMVHIIWQDNRDGNFEIYHKRSTNEGIDWAEDIRLTSNSYYSGLPSVAIAGQVVHVVWTDQRDGNNEIYYKRDPTGNIVGIENVNANLPKEFQLFQNYPNPFNPTTNIKFQIPKSGFVNMILYDILSREVTTLVNEQLNPGTYEVQWEASDFPSGVYYYKLIAADYTETKRMVLVK